MQPHMWPFGQPSSQAERQNPGSDVHRQGMQCTTDFAELDSRQDAHRPEVMAVQRLR